MDRINGADTTDIGDGKRGFKDENVVAGVTGTEVTAAFLNATQEEILKVIEEANIDADANDWTQLWQAIGIQIGNAIKSGNHAAAGNTHGTVQLATIQEALLGLNNTKAITPATLAASLGKTGDGLPLFLELSAAGQTAQTIPDNTPTRCDSLVAIDGNMTDQWNGYRFTVDANSLGVYGVLNRLNIQSELGEGAQTWKNGVNIRDYQLDNDAGRGNVFPFTHFVQLLQDGDYIEFYHNHKSGEDKDSNVSASSPSQAQIYRLLPYLPVI